MQRSTRQIQPIARKGELELWRIRISDRDTGDNLLLSFHRMNSENRFRKLIQLCAIYFIQQKDGSYEKIVMRQELDLNLTNTFEVYGKDHVQIGECTLSPERISGVIRSKGQELAWDFNITWASKQSYQLYPQILKSLGFVRPLNSTLNSSISLEGNVSFNGQKRELKTASGMIGRTCGSTQFHSWSWAHCDHFVDHRSGEPVHCGFEGIQFKSKIVGPLKSPMLSAFAFFYKDEQHLFTSPMNVFQVTSNQNENDWNIKAEKGDLSFHAQITGSTHRFVGTKIEDTDGSYLYSALNLASSMTLLVYRNGKLEKHLRSSHCGFEITSREKNPHTAVDFL